MDTFGVKCFITLVLDQTVKSLELISGSLSLACKHCLVHQLSKHLAGNDHMSPQSRECIVDGEMKVHEMSLIQHWHTSGICIQASSMPVKWWFWCLVVSYWQLTLNIAMIMVFQSGFWEWWYILTHHSIPKNFFYKTSSLRRMGGASWKIDTGDQWGWHFVFPLVGIEMPLMTVYWLLWLQWWQPHDADVNQCKWKCQFCLAKADLAILLQ